MNEVYDKIKKCYEQVRQKTDFEPKIASTVQGHKGRFVFGYIEEVL